MYGSLPPSQALYCFCNIAFLSFFFTFSTASPYSLPCEASTVISFTARILPAPNGSLLSTHTPKYKIGLKGLKLLSICHLLVFFSFHHLFHYKFFLLHLDGK